MSEENIEAVDTSCCASCGIAKVDDIELKECSDCDLARYCSDECQKDHKSQHEEDCKKRAAELRDELLFKQPESTDLGDCPICCLPMPLELSKANMHICCSKMICNGCHHANMIREIEGKIEQSCPFCRKPTVATDEERDNYKMKRVKAKDPVAMVGEGLKQYTKRDYSSAFEWYTKAAELGNAEAHFKLSFMYRDGQGVEKDRGKEMYHLEEATIGGHPYARHNLACKEERNGNIKRAVKYWTIAATQGLDHSIKTLMKYFKKGFVSKDDLAAALRAHQAAVDATKSPQREAADEYDRKMRKP
eukprot:scaffold7925_cov81-Skeletonema_dohrnii-CCMP3373.AAC.1